MKKQTKSKIDFRSDKKKPVKAKGELSQVATMAEQLQKFDFTIESLEEQLEVAKAQRDRIATGDLPALMEQFGITEFSLSDGSKITIRPFVKASLPSEGAILRCKDLDKRAEMRERLSDGFTYLTKSGAASLIKSTLKADFGKGTETRAKQALAILRKMGVKAEMSKGVHPQSLVAWVKERLEAGKPVDMDLFAVFSGDIAKIEQPRTDITKTEEEFDL